MFHSPIGVSGAFLSVFRLSFDGCEWMSLEPWSEDGHVQYS